MGGDPFDGWRLRRVGNHFGFEKVALHAFEYALFRTVFAALAVDQHHSGAAALTMRMFYRR
jgi:hypothetical protein